MHTRPLPREFYSRKAAFSETGNKRQGTPVWDGIGQLTGSTNYGGVMDNHINRRGFLRLAGLGGAIYVSGLSGWASAAAKAGAANEDFFFIQLSDSHWGFEGAPNPDAHGTLKKAVAAVNGLEQLPDFIVFTGDLTHTTDDPQERRKRLAEFKQIVSALKVKTVHFMPGEHDASLDHGEAYQEFFGKTHYTFDHKGVHFITIDNVSDPTGAIGEEQ